MGVGGQRDAPPTLPPGKRPYNHYTGGWVGPRAGLDVCRKTPPVTGIGFLDCPSRSESIYRLSYRGPHRLQNTE